MLLGLGLILICGLLGILTVYTLTLVTDAMGQAETGNFVWTVRCLFAAALVVFLLFVPVRGLAYGIILATS